MKLCPQRMTRKVSMEDMGHDHGHVIGIICITTRGYG
jgi:hypothetical protein